MFMATKSSKAVASKKALVVVKSAAPKKPMTRADRYAKLFVPTAVPADGGYIQQVHGYGTPTFSQVSSYAGV